VQTSELIKGKPRYTLNVVDADTQEILDRKNMGVFVVPLGCERELNIDSYEAQNDVSHQVNMARLVIVVLGRAHKYKDLQQVQDELSAMILDLCPSSCVNKENIPFLTSRNNLHVRELVYEDLEVVVEDVIDVSRKGENDEPLTSRQLKFYDNQTVC